MTLTAEEEARWQAAKDRVITLDPKVRDGIGVQKEKTLHAVLKNYYEPDRAFQEVPVGPFIADILRGGAVTEIQTANMIHMRDKLSFMLKEHDVCIVYPIPHKKWVVWLDPESGLPVKKNKSPYTGTFYQAFRELFWIDMYLGNPRLTIDLLLIDLEEYRFLDGWGTGGKRGSHRFDQLPLSIEGRLVLKSPSDYNYFLPDTLPSPFTSKDLAAAAGVKRQSVVYSSILKILTDIGTVSRVGKKGNAYLYTKGSSAS